MNKKYKFSVIIPIYNAGQYLDDAINSVISQTIGFSNIELILVNDGSTDNSEDICMKYKEKYSNIIYVKQKNKGVSSARNKGLSLATGQYVNFLDADDLVFAVDLSLFKNIPIACSDIYKGTMSINTPDGSCL